MDSANTVSAEILLIKMQKDESLPKIMEAATEFDAKTADEAEGSIMFCLSADSEKIDEFLNIMREYSILEICRTGNVSLERGSDTILQSINF